MIAAFGRINALICARSLQIAVVAQHYVRKPCAIVLTIDVINVEMKIKNVKKRKNRGENLKKNVCKRWIKNVADICHESSYYLCTLSHM